MISNVSILENFIIILQVYVIFGVPWYSRPFSKKSKVPKDSVEKLAIEKSSLIAKAIQVSSLIYMNYVLSIKQVAHLEVQG